MASGGRVLSIHVAANAAAPMQSLSDVSALAGLGLEGDRYFLTRGTYSDYPANGRHVTLIENETIDALRRDHGVAIDAAATRRNIVTLGVALNHLVDKEFTIGAVRLRGMRLCEPCMHLEKLSVPGVMRGLIHRGGLRAEILTGGVIGIGDSINVVD
jgi:MOSC domain-containing protein YiiM